MRLVLAIILACLCRRALCVGGVKRRLAEADQGGDEVPSAASSSSGHKAARSSGGGIRQRLAEYAGLGEAQRSKVKHFVGQQSSAEHDEGRRG